MTYSAADEPSVHAAFALAAERLAAEDAARREWLDKRCEEPEPCGRREVPLDRSKPRPPAQNRCTRWGCTRKVRCKGLCSTHYWQIKARERRLRAA